MADETKNSEGPTCACGKVDLYEDWLKQNEACKQDETSTSTSKAVDPISSSNGAGYEDSNPVQTNK
jgi:hypothetical protein